MLGVFKTSLQEGIEVIAGLIPIKLHLKKLRGRTQLQALALPTNHIIHLLMDSSFRSSNIPYPSSLSNFTGHQRKKIKGHLVDTFLDRFSFNLCMKGKSDKSCIQQLDSMVIKASSSQSTAIAASDASIKNDIAILISHTHISNQPLVKIIHHAAFVTSTEAEIFTIRCSINQATAKPNVSKIVIITNSIHAAKRIFNPFSHLLQI